MTKGPRAQEFVFVHVPRRSNLLLLLASNVYLCITNFSFKKSVVVKFAYLFKYKEKENCKYLLLMAAFLRTYSSEIKAWLELICPSDLIGMCQKI